MTHQYPGYTRIQNDLAHWVKSEQELQHKIGLAEKENEARWEKVYKKDTSSIAPSTTSGNYSNNYSLSGGGGSSASEGDPTILFHILATPLYLSYWSFRLGIWFNNKLSSGSLSEKEQKSKAKNYNTFLWGSLFVDAFSGMPFLGTAAISIGSYASARGIYTITNAIMDHKDNTRSHKLKAGIVTAAVMGSIPAGYNAYIAYKYPSMEVYVDKKLNYKTATSYMPIFEKLAKLGACSFYSNDGCNKIASIPYGAPLCASINDNQEVTIFGPEENRTIATYNLTCNSHEMDKTVADIRANTLKANIWFFSILAQNALEKQKTNDSLKEKKLAPTKPEVVPFKNTAPLSVPISPAKKPLTESNETKKSDLSDFREIALAGRSYYVTAQSLNIRTEPHAQSKIVGQTSRTSCLIVFGKATGSFLPVYGRAPDGTMFSGYAHKGHLRKSAVNLELNCGASFDKVP